MSAEREPRNAGSPVPLSSEQVAAAPARVRAALQDAVDIAAAEGMANLRIEGQLIRPLLAYGAATSASGEVPAGFWYAALAVQLAHEASLVHDDIVDASTMRRGAPTLAASRGTGAALVQGDHFLTTAYRLAAQTGSPVFATIFARSVERTVAGELAQGRSLGRYLEWAEYREIAMGKSGELIGCAFAAGPALDLPMLAPRAFELGRRIGLLYQMLDDLLDYCPGHDGGKPPLGDFAQGRWTWPLLQLPTVRFGEVPSRVAELLAAPAPGGSALRRCLDRLEADGAQLIAEVESGFDGAPVVTGVIEGWLERARRAVAREEGAAVERESRRLTGPSAALVDRAPLLPDVVDYFAANSRTFRFAARFYATGEMDRVARVYAYCRVMDDLVDDPRGEDPGRLLDDWVDLSRRAYDGRASGIDLVDRVMAEMADASVPFTYAAELAEGMRMDLRGERYPDLAALRRYSYRVASVVGLWLTEMAGVRDRDVLLRAESLGHAMQLTNILRDVGEDARRGRIYLPADRMASYEVTPADLCAACDPGAPLPAGYPDLIEELILTAERDYRLAFQAIPLLPNGIRRPVAVAASVYRGIHDEIRRAGHDNLHGRATTPGRTKAWLAVRALWGLRPACGPGLAVRLRPASLGAHGSR